MHNKFPSTIYSYANEILYIATVSISLFLKHKVFVLTGFIILISKMTKVIEKYTLKVFMIFLILETST